MILTASSPAQAAHFEVQLGEREKLGLLGDVSRWLVIPDPEGRRIGSGGSTLRVIDQFVGPDTSCAQALQGERLLIVHAGGESRRMPAYAVCGKLFAPIPGGPASALPYTLFDAQAETYLRLPANPEGQLIICSGDVLLRFDPRATDLSRRGLTGVASPHSADEATGHGVYAAVAGDGAVGRFLQKPSVQEMEDVGALDTCGRAAIDLGIMSFTPAFADRLLGLLRGRREQARTDFASVALDFYTEFACCLGAETTLDQYVRAVERHGASGLDARALGVIWEALHDQPFFCSLLEECEFLHFGTTADYVQSVKCLSGTADRTAVVFGCELAEDQVAGAGNAVVEACAGEGKICVGGRNLVAGALAGHDVTLKPGVCLDVMPGRTQDGAECFFHRLYGIDDTFKGTMQNGSCTFLNEPMQRWLERHGVRPDALWPEVEQSPRSLWNARLYPAADTRDRAGLVLWMQEAQAAQHLKEEWQRSRRYSMEEMLVLADGRGFWQIRQAVHRRHLLRGLPHSLDRPCELSADDLACVLAAGSACQAAESLVAHAQSGAVPPLQRARVLHTVGSALAKLGLAPRSVPGPEALRAAAFEAVRGALESSVEASPRLPLCAIKRDQIVWGRSPARLDLAGGWTDTPPYSLEHGGIVVNAAVDLNGQPPVQVFARVSPEPKIKLSSIDLGLTETVEDMAGLLDHRSPQATFSIPKAALALWGLSPEFHTQARAKTLREMLEGFGGGIELTLLCAMPKGSGLGTSSILGAVLIRVLNRLSGTLLAPKELFHRVLVLEQILTTGGGWQDQIGGASGGLKRITTTPGAVPDPLIELLPHDLLCPAQNGGCTVLYYTGITRLAKDILQKVVGRYLDRDRETLRVLARLTEEAENVRAAVVGGDLEEFGRTIDRVWELNKKLDPGSTNAHIETLMGRVKRHALGAKLLGAGGGGFLLAVCPDVNRAAALRADLEAEPPNELGRFFDFQVNPTGLEISLN